MLSNPISNLRYYFFGQSTAAVFFMTLLSMFVVRLNAQTCFFIEDFESGSLNASFWTPTTSPQGIVNVVNGYSNSGSYSLFMGKSADAGGFQTQKADLHLNLQGYNDKEVELNFWIYDYNDETHPEDGLFFSNDGGASFHLVLAFKPGDWCDNYGQFPPIDVDALAKQKFGPNWATSNFVIRWQQRDDSDIYGDSDGLIIDDICLTEAPKFYFPLSSSNPFTDDFETCGLGQYWAWRFADQTNTLATIPTRPSNFVGAISGAGHDSNCAVFMGKRCDDSGNAFITNALDLHLNLANVTQAALSFWIRDNDDETQIDDGIYFSNDGGATFKKVLAFQPDDWCNNDWGQFPPIDIDELAAKVGLTLTEKFIVRFQQHDNSDVYGDADGLYIDDINVYIPAQEFVVVNSSNPFCETFENGFFGPMWAWRWADQTNSLAAVPTRPSNYVGITSGNGYNNSQFAVFFGKWCDDSSNGFVTNALDLYLNLQGQTQVDLTFHIFDVDDETQADDGIYFSNDGGLTFKKAFDFRPGDWCNNQWGQFPPLDIDELAAKIGMTLTDKFVVRFQQHDDSDIYGDSDGLWIDDVCVTVPNILYTPVPYFDDFETGKLEAPWLRRFATTTGPSANVYDFTRPSNLAFVAFGAGNTSEYGVFMGKSCDDGNTSFAANALDLHANLLGAHNVTLQFDMLSYDDETHNWDAIYFSNDGGVTFKKVYALEPGNLPNSAWQIFPQQPLNVDALAAAAPAMAFTEKFVIRFQQYDNSDQFGDADGIYLDNIFLNGIQTNSADEIENLESQVTVSPNPATEHIQVTLHKAPDGSAQWVLYDLQGRQLRAGNTGGQPVFNISLRDIPDGMLVLGIKDVDGVQYVRVVKNK